MSIYYHTNKSPATYCAGTSVALTGIGASTYTWSPAAVNGVSFMPQSSAIYTVTGQSVHGCTNTMTQQVNIISPTITASSGTICAGQNFLINAGGANTYTITGGTFSVTPLGTTSYTVTGSSVEGCVSLFPAISTVSVVALPVVAIANGTACFGSQYTLQPSGASTYSFSGGQAVNTITATSVFTVTGFNALGCPAAVTAAATMSMIPLPVLSASSGTICTGESFNINAQGAASYTYSSGSSFVSPLSSTNYTVTGFSAEGCVSQKVLNVEVRECTGIRNYTNEKGITIGPNPSTGLFYYSAVKGTSYQVFDLSGKILLSGSCNSEKEIIDLKIYPPGVYVLQVKTQGQILTQRLVIAK